MIICIEIPDYDGKAFEVTRDNDFSADYLGDK